MTKRKPNATVVVVSEDAEILNLPTATRAGLPSENVGTVQGAEDGFPLPMTDVMAYRELAMRGQLFMASLQAVVALSTLSVTATGFILTNPAGSRHNIALMDVCVALASAPAGIATVHVAYGAKSNTAVTQTTPLTVRSGLLESVRGVGLAASEATLPAAPVAIRAIGGGPVATGSVTSPFIRDEVRGQIIIPPGSSLSLGYITTAISVVASMCWAELPIA
jgi:hypothetical protein